MRRGLTAGQWRRNESLHLSMAIASTVCGQQAVLNAHAGKGSPTAFITRPSAIDRIANEKLIRRTA